MVAASPSVECACHTSLIADSSTCSDEVIAKLRGICLATLIQHVQRLGIHRTFMTGIVPCTTTERFAGRARTLRCLPTRADAAKALAPKPGEQTLHFKAYEHTGAGEVLVIDARGELEAAVGEATCSSPAFRQTGPPRSSPTAPSATCREFGRSASRSTRAECRPPPSARTISPWT
jgi:hypothetical protein